MSWPAWPTGTPALPTAVPGAVLPNAINPAPAITPMGYSQEQWAQAQQQNWQQWAQWQQQYQQWHQQYGAEYQKSLTAMQGAVPTPMQMQPPLPISAAAPPLPDSKPPLPKEDPPMQPSAVSAYSSVPQTGYSTAAPMMQQQMHFPSYYPVQQTLPTWQTQNVAQKRPYTQEIETDPAKKALLDKPVTNQWNQQMPGAGQNYSQPPPATAAVAAAAPIAQSTDPKGSHEELSEAEKKFDKEFAAWEAQFNKWREQNANHPDKVQYKEYEKKWESWRNSLLERREQMRRKRVALQATSAPKSQSSLSNQDTLINKTDITAAQPSSLGAAYNESALPATNDLFNKPPPNENNDPLTFKPKDGGFLTTGSSSEGIPGLDLVKDDTKEELPDRSEEIQDEAEEGDTKAKSKLPDFEAISKGINTILGDQKLLSMLSMVSQNAPPAVASTNVTTDTVSNIAPNYGQNFSLPPPNFQQYPNSYTAPPPPYQDPYYQQARSSTNDYFQKGQFDGPPPNVPAMHSKVDDYSNPPPISNNTKGMGNVPSNYGSGARGLDNQFSRDPPQYGKDSDNYYRNDNRNDNFSNDRFSSKNNLNREDDYSNDNYYKDNYGKNRYDSGNKFDDDDVDYDNYNDDEDYDKYNDMFQEDEEDSYQEDRGRQPHHQRQFKSSMDQPQKPFMNQSQNQIKSLMDQPKIQPLMSQVHQPPPKIPSLMDTPILSRDLKDNDFDTKDPYDDFPLFEPAKVIDYEHVSQTQEDDSVSIEPVNMFDYKHKPVNCVPHIHRPKWLAEAIKFIREFDPLAQRYDYERIIPPSEARYSAQRGENRFRYDERDRDVGRNRQERSFDRDDYRRNSRRSEDDTRGRNGSRDRDRSREGYRAKDHDNNRKQKNNRDNRKRTSKISSKDFDELSDADMDFEEVEQSRHHSEQSSRRSRSPELSNPPNPASKQFEITMIEDIINPPGRFNRPPRIVIILRGPPGSGKTHLAKLIKDKEIENGGSAPRILSLDDYFMVEHEKKVVEDGKTQFIKEMVYEYEAEMEESYRQSFMRSFKKTITDGYFPFIVVDNVNDKVKYFGEMWSFAKQNGFQVYICQLDLDPVQCYKRNIHNRSEVEIEDIISGWEPTPSHHPTIDASSLLQNSNIAEVEMEVEDEKSSEPTETNDPEDHVRSKWDNFDCSNNNLAKLDGVNKPLRKSRTMEEYLQLEEWSPPKSVQPGKKRVRWADLEEQRNVEKMRAIGFVVGQTDWDRMMDPTGSRALTKTKYIERVSRGRR
uniref:YLP motif-containing protein 1 n=1 Tax=Diabrotica virgifera virgifera TaxID=50390 RepID=A0A6P7F4H8_DIAVI